MSNGISASASASRIAVSNFSLSKLKTSHSSSPSFVNLRPSLSSDLKLKGLGFSRRHHGPQTQKWICNSSGNNESKTVLDAFFLGKAIGEALTERVESVIGEVLSTIGRVQSEQQKQVQDFQEEVLERAKRAKDKAAREAMEAQGLISRPVTIETTPVTSSTSDRIISVDQPLSSAKQNPSSASNQNPISRTPIGD